MDTIGDLGKSILSRRLEKTSDYTDWLIDVCHELQLEPANILGFSQGGWIALNYAVHCPEGIDKLIMISPNAGFVPIRLQFMARLIWMAVFPTQRVVEKWARWNSISWRNDDRYFRLINDLIKAGIRGQSRSRSGVLPITFSDTELRHVSCAVLMLVGEQEVVNDPLAALHRAQSLLPRFKGELIADARHMLPFDQPDIVCERVLKFIR